MWNFIKQYKTQFFILLPLFSVMFGFILFANERNIALASTISQSNTSTLNNGLLVYATFDMGYELTNFASSTNPLKQNAGRSTAGQGVIGQGFDQTTLGMGTFSKISTAYAYTSNTLPWYNTIADDFTVTFAARNSNGNSIGRVISARPTTGLLNWELYQNTSNRLYVQIWDIGGTKNTYCDTKPVWTFYELKKSGTTVTLSQNNRTCGTINLVTSVSTTPSRLYIGGIAWGNGQYDGKIDEVRAYNRALTTYEETMLYNQTMYGLQINTPTITGKKPAYSTSTLILHTPFDTYTNTTTVNDVSGSGYNGTISTPATASPYVSSSAPNGFTEFNFPRNNDTTRHRYVDFGDLAAFNFVTTSQWSCGAWVRIDLKNWVWGAGGSDTPVLIGKKPYGNTTSTGWQWTLDNRNLKGNQGIRFNNGSTQNDLVTTGAATPRDDRNAFNDGKYHHFAFTVSSVGKYTANSRSVMFYFDGKPTMTSKVTAGASQSDNLTNTTSLVYGKNSVSNSSYFKYEMDDVRCYNTELTDKDWQDIYNFNKESKVGTTTVWNTNGLIAKFSFSGDNPLVDSVNGVALTKNLGGYAAGTMGQGWDNTQKNTTGGQGGYLNLASITAETPLSFTGTHSYSAWVYIPKKAWDNNPGTSSSSTGWGIVGKLNGASGTQSGSYLRLITTSGDPNISWTFGDGVTVNNTIYSRSYSAIWNFWDRWTFITATWDGTSGSNGVKVYIDGKLWFSTQTTKTNIGTGLGTFSIGRYPSANTNYNNGKIDEVQIYNRVLSATEVQQLYNLSK